MKLSGNNRIPCGAHTNNEFDYTCDGCMLPEPHPEPPELNDLND